MEEAGLRKPGCVILFHSHKLYELYMAVHSFSVSTCESKAGGTLEGRGQAGLCSEFHASQNYIVRFSLKNKIINSMKCQLTADWCLF